MTGSWAILLRNVALVKMKKPWPHKYYIGVWKDAESNPQCALIKKERKMNRG